MTERERWAVYPLLFLTLGIAVKDKIIGVVRVENVQCRNLLCNTVLVTDPQGKQQVVVSSTPGGGVVRTLGNAPQLDVLVGHTQHLAGLMFVDAEGNIRSPTLAVPTGLSPHAKPEPAADSEPAASGEKAP
jgi:hypothetical protein